MDNATIDAWTIRLTDIEDALLPARTEASRTKRGLLNIDGELSRSLFGTATESQMLSVINQTHSAVVQNRKHINVLQSYVQKVSDEVRHIANLWQNQDKQLQVINAKLRIEQCLSAMESAHAHWVQQTARFNRQKASLELGFLTEELLSRTE